MARADYDLQVFKKVILDSSNGSSYQARIWTSYSGGTGEWKLASNRIVTGKHNITFKYL